MGTKIAGLRKELFLFLVAFLVYNINLRELTLLTGDTIGARYTPISIIKEFDLYLDEFPHLYLSQANKNYQYIQASRGHYISAYPVMIPILAVPVYFIPVVMGIPSYGIFVDMMSKIAASIIVSLSVIFIFLACKYLIEEKVSFYIAILYAFATSSWSVSSQGLWQHGPSQFFLAITLYFLLRGLREEIFIFYAGISSGIAFACRSVNVLIIFFLILYVLHQHRRHFFKFIIPIIFFVISIISYNLFFFNSIQGGDAKLNTLHGVLHGIKGTWSTPFFEGLSGLLISPNRGILIYSPFLIFAFWGMVLVWNKKELRIFRYISLSIFATIFLYSKYSVWWGGQTYGYRYLCDILSFLSVFIALVWNIIFKNKVLKAIFIFLVICSIFIQIVGAFCYPSGWNSIPVSIDLDHSRLWDWKDTQILRCIKSGPRKPWIGWVISYKLKYGWGTPS